MTELEFYCRDCKTERFSSSIKGIMTKDGINYSILKPPADWKKYDENGKITFLCPECQISERIGRNGRNLKKSVDDFINHPEQYSDCMLKVYRGLAISLLDAVRKEIDSRGTV